MIQIYHCGVVKKLRLEATLSFPTFPPSTLQQFVERDELIYFGLGGAPATNDFGASLGEKDRF